MQNRIRKLRKERHMSQIRLSIELEITQTTVSSYEIEKCYPSFPQLVKMSELFDASIDYIMGLSDVRRPGESHQDVAWHDMLNACQRLNSRQMELVGAYAQGLADMGRVSAKN